MEPLWESPVAIPSALPSALPLTLAALVTSPLTLPMALLMALTRAAATRLAVCVALGIRVALLIITFRSTVAVSIVQIWAGWLPGLAEQLNVRLIDCARMVSGGSR